MDGKGQPRRDREREREGERELKFRCAPLLETLTGSFCSAVARGHSDYVKHGGPPPPPAPPFSRRVTHVLVIGVLIIPT